MYKKNQIFFFLIVVLISFSGFSQLKFSGIVVDAESKNPISYATILNLNSKNGLYTTEKGIFEIIINKSDSIQISCVGYKPVTILGILNGRYDLDTIFLIPQSKKLPEVVVSSINWAKYREKKIGYSGIKSRWHVGGLTGLQYAVYIPNEKKIKNSYIAELIYKIEIQRTDSIVIRIHLYSANDDGTPGFELLDSNYFVILSGKMDKIIAFNIISSKIIFPQEGIFVGFEWLGIYDSKSNTILNKQIYEPVIGFNDKLNTVITYAKTPNGKWEKTDLRKYYKGDDLEKHIFSRNAPNASFGMTIKIPR